MNTLRLPLLPAPRVAVPTPSPEVRRERNLHRLMVVSLTTMGASSGLLLLSLFACGG